MTLSLEEAAALLGVGRTKAYTMTREWRATGGPSVLPVIDCGHALRVPLHPLANLLGVDVADLVAVVRDAPAAAPTPVAEAVASTMSKPTRKCRVTAGQRRIRRRT